MTKRLNSKHKVDRRLKVNLWGRPKSPLNDREYAPGQHGQRRKKPTDYGVQLMAKQKLKGYYGNIGEKQFKKYLENYNRALSSRDAEKYVDGEKDVIDMEKLINDFALIRNQWLGITKGLDQKQWQITNIVKLRVAGMEDATIK